MDLSLLYSHSCGIHLRRWNMHIDTSEEVHSWQLILPHKEKPSQLLHEYKSIHPIFRGIAMHDCSVSFIDCCWVLLMCSLLSTCQHSNLTNWNLKIPKNLGAISFNLLPEISKLLSQAVFFYSTFICAFPTSKCTLRQLYLWYAIIPAAAVRFTLQTGGKNKGILGYLWERDDGELGCCRASVGELYHAINTEEISVLDKAMRLGGYCWRGYFNRVLIGC